MGYSLYWTLLSCWYVTLLILHNTLYIDNMQKIRKNKQQIAFTHSCPTYRLPLFFLYFVSLSRSSIGYFSFAFFLLPRWCALPVAWRLEIDVFSFPFGIVCFLSVFLLCYVRTNVVTSYIQCTEGKWFLSLCCCYSFKYVHCTSNWSMRFLE